MLGYRYFDLSIGGLFSTDYRLAWSCAKLRTLCFDGSDAFPVRTMMASYTGKS